MKPHRVMAIEIWLLDVPVLRRAFPAALKGRETALPARNAPQAGELLAKCKPRPPAGFWLIQGAN